MWDMISNWLASTPGVIAIITICLTVFSRMVIKIFRFGATFKTELVTKDEQKAFEESIRKELRSWRDELQRNILETCLRTIEKELQSVSEIKEISQEMKTNMEVEKERMKVINESLTDVKSLADTIRQMNSRLNRLEYGDTNSTARRTE